MMTGASVLLGLVAAFALATMIAGRFVRYGFPLPAPDKRIGCVDGLRGYLALSVLAYHSAVWVQVTRLSGTWSVPTTNWLSELGNGAVGLFFMTTGLVFYPRILKGARQNSWTSVYIGRFFRIAPLMLGSIALVVIIVMIKTGRVYDAAFPNQLAHWVVGDAPPLLGYANAVRVNAGVLWSLWYEWVFYLAVLPICAAARDLTRSSLPSWTVPVALIATSLVVRAVYPAWELPRYMPLFGIGMLAYEVQQRDFLAKLLRSNLAGVAAAACLMAAVIVAPRPGLMTFPLFGLFFACVACGNSLGGILKTNGALALGECSYSIYTLHGFVLSLVFFDGLRLTSIMPTSVLAAIEIPIAGAAVTFLSVAVFLIVERPAIDVGRKIVRRLATGRVQERPAELEVAP
jgi:peptidoglycan/LPS O-acetylase OafA/YrhL